jgi:hypothetical protein
MQPSTLFDDASRGAVLSPCGSYRYRLWRVWDPRSPRALFVMLNPSTADALADDPTIRRCTGFARAWGMGGIDVVNLYAWRSTDPEALRTLELAWRIVGPERDAHITAALAHAGVVVLAWGAHPLAAAEAPGVVARIVDAGLAPQCLGVTATGHPRHPLYVRGDTPLVVYALPCVRNATEGVRP